MPVPPRVAEHAWRRLLQGDLFRFGRVHDRLLLRSRPGIAWIQERRSRPVGGYFFPIPPFCDASRACPLVRVVCGASFRASRILSLLGRAVSRPRAFSVDTAHSGGWPRFFSPSLWAHHLGWRALFSCLGAAASERAQPSASRWARQRAWPAIIS